MLKQINFNKLGIISIMPRLEPGSADFGELAQLQDRNWPGAEKTTTETTGKGDWGIGPTPNLFWQTILIVENNKSLY